MIRTHIVSRQALEKQAKQTGRARLSQRYDRDRPRTRKDCVDGPRPCPWAGCRHHLFLNPDQGGNIHFPFGEDEEALLHMAETCSLDVAARGAQTLESLAKMYGQSRQNFDQILNRALARLRAAVKAGGHGQVGRAFERLRAAYEDSDE